MCRHTYAILVYAEQGLFKWQAFAGLDTPPLPPFSDSPLVVAPVKVHITQFSVKGRSNNLKCGLYRRFRVPHHD